MSLGDLTQVVFTTSTPSEQFRSLSQGSWTGAPSTTVHAPSQRSGHRGHASAEIIPYDHA